MDRHLFYGDPYMSKVPAKGLVSKAYAAERRKLIDRSKAALDVPSGDPWKYETSADRPGAAVVARRPSRRPS
jgi:gamma-glutamyltranspeptidase/glutathione hydrolase